jgi:hypothetical protein
MGGRTTSPARIGTLFDRTHARLGSSDEGRSTRPRAQPGWAAETEPNTPRPRPLQKRPASETERRRLTRLGGSTVQGCLLPTQRPPVPHSQAHRQQRGATPLRLGELGWSRAATAEVSTWDVVWSTARSRVRRDPGRGVRTECRAASLVSIGNANEPVNPLA